MSKKPRSFEEIRRQAEAWITSSQNTIPNQKKPISPKDKQKVLLCVQKISEDINKLIEVIPKANEEFHGHHLWARRYGETTSRKIRWSKNQAASSIAKLYDMTKQSNIGSNDFQTQVGKLSKELWETTATTITREEIISFREKLLETIQQPIRNYCK